MKKKRSTAANTVKRNIPDTEINKMISIKQNYSLGSMDPGLLLFIKNNLLFYCVSKPISRVMSWVIIYLGHPLPNGSSGPPESTTGSRIAFFSALLQMEFTCARPVTRPAVVSYTAFPPLPENRRFISVALVWELPPPDVIRHPAL